MDGKNKETIYENDSTVVMSEKVQSLAGSIYQEFERMMQKYDEDVVKTLMPLLVNVLESLDLAYQSNQEQEVELELLREDNEQLITQYEREKVARKQSEQKLIETEDIAEAENKELASRLESLESIVRMLELKHKNSLEHASRLEEREAELKKEYNKLHERYSELFKTHVDYMERSKLLMGSSSHSQMNSVSERLDVNRSALHPMVRSSGPVSFGFASLENSVMDEETICSTNSNSSGSGPPSLQNEFENVATEKICPAQFAETPPQNCEPPATISVSATPKGTTTTKKEERSANNLYQELTFHDDNVESEEAEVTGRWVHPGEYASSVSDNFFGMGKEVENLIMENNELLATKNALNIVKDDLILRVDELTGEIEILREELNAVILSRNKIKGKVVELEEELKKAKEQVKLQSNSENEDEGDVPMAQRKRFTRVEMARVLMERNQYKERFMELQDAVRWSEMMRATRVDSLDKKSKQSIWKFFSNLFSSNDRPPNEQGGPLLRYESSGSNVAPEITEGRLAITQGENNNLITTNALVLSKDFVAEDHKSSQKAMQRRREQYRQVRAHVQKEDGRLQAYGWSLPGSKNLQSTKQTKHAGGVRVPVPVFCRPLAEASPHMKVWCAAGVNLNGGFTKDGGCMVGASVFYSKDDSKVVDITNEGSSDLEALEKKINLAMKSSDEELQLSSYVWICTSNHTVSTVTVIDAKNPAEILDSFPVCQTHLLCICSVIGALEKDYSILENSEVTKSGDALEKPGEGIDNIGQIKYVRIGDKNENHEIIENTGTVIISSDIVEDNDKKQSPEFNAVLEDVPAPPISPFHLGQRNNTQSSNNYAPNSMPFSHPINPISGSDNPLDEPVMSSIGPTMWLGAQNGMLYVHSAVARWRTCLHSIKLPDAVLAIVYIESRVVVALANGCLAVFGRQTSGEWDLNAYHLLTLGSPKRSIRCLTVVGDKVWAAHQNKIHVVDPVSLNIVHTMEAHPRKESQIRQMAASGLGVWVSIRLDSTLRLYHTDTYDHLQDIDIEPYVSKMLGTGKLGFSFVRITALLVSCNRLWIGTGNGVIISIPLINDGTSARDTFIPKCCMANAQLSFHGHRDAVKFFVSVPMSLPLTEPSLPLSGKKPVMLVLSGGEGYIDFRQEEHADDATDIATHLLVWQVSPA
uniref:JNK-interacting protein 3 n=1 Tax=Culicoides sonorensis TaxID=179676 RepID=A0A336LP60_CULSO